MMLESQDAGMWERNKSGIVPGAPWGPSCDQTDQRALVAPKRYELYRKLLGNFSKKVTAGTSVQG